MLVTLQEVVGVGSRFSSARNSSKDIRFASASFFDIRNFNSKLRGSRKVSKRSSSLPKLKCLKPFLLICRPIKEEEEEGFGSKEEKEGERSERGGGWKDDGIGGEEELLGSEGVRSSFEK